MASVASDGLSSAVLGEVPPVVRQAVRDLLPDLRFPGGAVLDTVGGLGVRDDSMAWAVTDAEGVNDRSGETLLLNVAVY